MSGVGIFSRDGKIDITIVVKVTRLDGLSIGMIEIERAVGSKEASGTCEQISQLRAADNSV